MYPELEESYNKYARKAKRYMDDFTSGIDGVKKLQVAMPIDEDDVAAVKDCFCDLIRTIHYVEKAREDLNKASDFTIVNGSIAPKVVSSVSSGSESVSYSASANYTSEYLEAAKSNGERKLCYKLMDDTLRGVSDANGVSLLYRGPYPYVR